MSKDLFPKLIALSGVSKSGKDTFFKLLSQIRPGAIRISAGDIIRADCAGLIKEKMGIDIFNCTPAEKELSRDILVGYANSQRKATKGKYFTNILSGIMREWEQTMDENAYFVMTDLRFAEYDHDEVDWAKDNDGVVIHITRRFNFSDGNGTYEQVAPNPTEALNDPKVKAKSDFQMTWINRDNIEDLIPDVWNVIHAIEYRRARQNFT